MLSLDVEVIVSLVLAFLALVSIPSAHAAICTFNVSSGTWETAGDWTSCGGHVPGPGDTAFIPSGDTVTVTANENIGAGAINNLGTLIVNSGVTLQFASLGNDNTGNTLINKGTLTGTDLYNDGVSNSLTNSGTITVSYLGTDGTSNSFTNSGTVTVSGDLYNDGNLNSLTNGPSGTITVRLILHNDGTSNSLTNCGGTITYGSFVGPPPIVNGGSACNVFSTTIIPEYPLGLPILAILTIIGYGLIRRRTRN